MTDDTGKVSLKPEITWSNVEDEASLGNYCVLNAILNGVDQNLFKLINRVTSVKEA